MLSKAEIQRLRSLREKKHREELGLFVIEGEKVVGELLNANFPFEEIYATAAWLEVRSELTAASRSESLANGSSSNAATRQAPSGSRIIPVTADEMERASHFPTPSPVLAVGK